MVHDTFVCKPGQASKMARLFKEMMTGQEEFVNILTDMTGEFNRVVMVSKYDNLSAYEQNFQKYMQDSDEMKKMKEKMKGYQDMYLTGSREIFQVW
jgi:predicted translin family RNA/ssDNA-binding protein